MSLSPKAALIRTKRVQHFFFMKWKLEERGVFKVSPLKKTTPKALSFIVLLYIATEKFILY